MRLDQADAARVGAMLDALTATGAERLGRDGFPPHRRRFRRAALARYVGQSSEIEVALPDGDPLASFADRFGDTHQRDHGFRAPQDEPVELVGISVIARGIPDRPRLPESIPPSPADVPASRATWFPNLGWVEVPVIDRAGLAGEIRHGPLIVQEYDATCLVPYGAGASLDDFGNIRLNYRP
jgi:N-methylhydantoinase A